MQQKVGAAETLNQSLRVQQWIQGEEIRRLEQALAQQKKAIKAATTAQGHAENWLRDKEVNEFSACRASSVSHRLAWQAINKILAAHEGEVGRGGAMDVDSEESGLDLGTLESDKAQIGGTTASFGAVEKALKKKKKK